MAQANPQSTTLLRDLTVVCAYEGGALQTVAVSFTSIGELVWGTTVSLSNPVSVLGKDASVGQVTIRNGATVDLARLGQGVMITFTGTVDDGDMATEIVQQMIAQFSPEAGRRTVRGRTAPGKIKER